MSAPDRQNPEAYALPALVFTLMLVLHLAGMDDSFGLHRQRLEAGQWWLLLSGNFVHLNTAHLLMNLAAYGLLVAVLQGDTPWLWQLLCILLSSLTVGLSVWYFAREIGFYAGFSGVLHGLMVLFALRLIKVLPWLAGAALLLVCGKVSHELLLGASTTTAVLINGSVVVESHLAGLLAGAASYACFFIAQAKKR